MGNNKINRVCFLFPLMLLLGFSSIQGQNTEKLAQSKINKLRKLIKKSEKKAINVLKEKTTIRTAEIFLRQAEWDEKNTDKNEYLFSIVKPYKKEAKEKAKELPEFQRKEINLMLDKAINQLELVLSGKEKRQYTPEIKWDKVRLQGDQLIFENQPVFLADYTWKPNSKEFTQYHGDLDSFYIAPGYVKDKEGTINPGVLKRIEEKPSGSIGFIFMNHKNPPKWTKEVYGPNFKMREDTYTAYDIDNPGAKELQSHLLKAIVPKAAGKKYSELGYMLVNEPHFFVYKDKTKKNKPWATGPVSGYTIEKFKQWLKGKHQNIDSLNTIWNTNYASFETLKVDIPLDISLKGTPLWYDWNAFNMDRVTDWYAFLKNEIQKHDAKAKVHLKIMPNLWSDNARAHGIDLEALTDLSEIVGNDSGAEHKLLWGKPHWDNTKYQFDWRELCMAYDFMKSVSPNKINFNTELHYLSTVKSRDLYLDPNYARATFWLAHTYGMTASQIWYWPRGEDGSISIKAGEDKGYAGSNSQQPRVTNEIAMTMIDLNANAKEIMAMQRQRKPIRLFYSKTSAINQKKHMDRQFDLYEALHFEGTPLGFVTETIFNKQNHRKWDVVLVYDTPNVTVNELNALQKYLDNGGTVIVDQKSLLKNEYGQKLEALKPTTRGKLIRLNTIETIKEKALTILKERKLLSQIQVVEKNEINAKGCAWKVVKNKAGDQVLSVVNVGKTAANLTIRLNGSNNVVCTDIVKGVQVSSTPVLQPNEVYFVTVAPKK